MDKESYPLTLKQKQDTTDIFHSKFKQSLNKLSRIITNDTILKGIEVINTELKTKMGYFYEQLFCYLCNFTYPKTGFDLINEIINQIFLELKTDWSTDNHNESNFHLLGKYKTNNQTQKFITFVRMTNVEFMLIIHITLIFYNNRSKSLGVLL